MIPIRLSVAHWLLGSFLLAVSVVRGANHTVSIFDFYFTPTNLTVMPGDTVTWINRGTRPHDTAALNGAWASPLLTSSEEFFSHTFTQPGQFPYVCLVHIAAFPQQTGLVVVASANLPPTVRITAPVPGSVFTAPGAFTITADAADPDGTVATVEFFVNNAPVGTSSGPAFSADVSGLGAGTYTITAVATDNQGAATTSDPLTVLVQEDVPVTFPLSVSVLPPAAGSIALDPPQPLGGYAAGTMVTLTASAAAGFAFDGWSGDGVGSQNPLAIVMSSARSVTANFSSNVVATRLLTLATNPPGSGSIQVAPAPNGPSGTYLDGTVVILTAVPAPDFAFTNWSGAVSGTSNRVTVVMDSDKVVTASFVPALVVRFVLEVEVVPAQAGVVLITPGSSDGSYPAGTVVALAAQPAPGFAFVRWLGAFNGSNNPIVLTMNGNRSATAEFAPIAAVDFDKLRGAYSGLLLDSMDTNYTTSGLITVRLLRTGAFRGKAVIGGIGQAIRGQFDRFGYAPLVLRQGTLSGSLRIDGDGLRIDGELTDAGNSNPTTRRSPALLLYRSGSATNLEPYSGSYQLSIEAAEPVLAAGSATLVVSPNGVVRVRGILGDGTAWTDRTFLSPDGTIPLFAPLYRQRGLLIGWVELPGDSSLGGIVRWFRPADSRNRRYPDGFSLRLPVTGSRAE